LSSSLQCDCSPSRIPSVRLVVRISIAALSFAVYAIAVLMLDQGSSTSFIAEEAGPIPVDLSQRLYQTGNGRMDTGMYRFFLEALGARLTAKKAIDEALNGRATPTGISVVAQDGNGVGGIVIVEAAFALFGPSTQALPLFFLALIGISAAAFVARYQSQRMSAVPILFLGLTLLLLTVLTATPTSSQVPIGGIRYYAVVGILPALHWCFEFIGDDDGPRKSIRWALLIIQVVILGLAILVRGSPIYLLVPVIVCAAVLFWRCRVRRPWRAFAAFLLVPLAVIFLEVGQAPRFAFPEYSSTGRLYGIVWHRVFISFGLHPEWPFSGVRELFPCPEVPEGITPKGSDRSGHCVWLKYSRDHNLMDAALNGVYGGNYERVLRTAFFTIVRKYPRESFETFFYYKPSLIFHTMTRWNLLWWAAAPTEIIWLALLQGALLAGFVLVQPPRAPIGDAMNRAGMLPLFVIPGLLPPLVAWGGAIQIADLILYMMCGCAIVLWVVVSAACHVLRNAKSNPGAEK
jgi:hypothetical protein